MQLLGARDPEVQLDLGRLGNSNVEAETRHDQCPGTRYAELQDVATGDRLQSPTLRCSQWEAGGS